MTLFAFGSNKPLLPHDEFEATVMSQNFDRGRSEANYRRQTGRTTRLCIDAVNEAYLNGKSVCVVVPTTMMQKLYERKINRYGHQMYGDQFTTKRIRVICAHNRVPSSYGMHDVVFLDSSFYDVHSFKTQG